MNTNEVSMISVMFEEIKKLIKKSENREQSTVSPPDLSGIESKVNQSEERLLSKLDEIKEFISHPAPQKHFHRISIDIASSWVFIALISLSLLVICSIGINISQQNKNGKLRYNDLKYRYIRMTNGISPEDLNLLENIFRNPDNNKVINRIRTDVETYEQKIKEQAEKLQQMNRDSSDVQQLQKEINDLKVGK